MQLTQMTDAERKRFWAKVRKSRGCWLWTGSRNRKGYGRFMWRGRVRWAHRLAYVDAHGTLDPNLLVCHHCDTPACVRPDHLFQGTQIDNKRDSMRKGRAYFATNWRGGGETHPRARLTARQVRQIRRLVDEGFPYSAIATVFACTYANIYSIARHINWRSVA